jgi:nitrite reductase (NADH) large subunit
MGDKDAIDKDDEAVSYSEQSRNVYKKLVLRNNRLAGAVVMGDGAGRLLAQFQAAEGR